MGLLIKFPDWSVIGVRLHTSISVQLSNHTVCSEIIGSELSFDIITKLLMKAHVIVHETVRLHIFHDEQ